MGNSLAEKHHITAPLVHGRKWDLDLSLSDFWLRMTISPGDTTEPCISFYHHMVTPLSNVLPHPFSILPPSSPLCCLSNFFKGDKVLEWFCL